MSAGYMKRDITTSNPPAPEQIGVGEVVINAVTGIMYSKLITLLFFYLINFIFIISAAYNVVLNQYDTSDKS